MIRVTRDCAVHSFSAAHSPAATVLPGDSVLLSTSDCFSGAISPSSPSLERLDRSRANPATGPIYVKGALPGTALVVDILELAPSSTGVTATLPGMGLLGHRVPGERVRFLQVGPDSVAWDDLLIPVRPMLGVLGVAPAEGEISTVEPGPHGGNLDALGAGAGARVYLPVFQHGGLFAAGDMHAAMGDGEISGTGVEVSGTALLRLDVDEGLSINWPWLEDDESLAILVSGRDLERAVTTAAGEMVAHIEKRLGLDFADAYLLCGSVMSLGICQVVNPRYTVRAQIPRWVLPGREALGGTALASAGGGPS